MLEYLKDLCLIDGTSGREDKVREYIISKIDGKCEYSVDPIGNILVYKKGKKAPKNKVMISAHMDEVALLITCICDNGWLRFTNVGGIDSKVISGRAVTVGDKKITGIIGNKAVHLTEGKESVTAPKIDKMYIDIGAKSAEEAKKYVSIGDCAYFKSDYVSFGKDKIKAKAIDDRFGCAIMLKMINEGVEYDTSFAFLVQEEVGCRGAGPAVFSIRPDYAIVLEATTASDIAGVADEDSVCTVGKGAVISFMDRSTVYNRTLFKRAFELAENESISIQPKTTVAGGNDAGTIHKACEGVRTIAISLPCRYIHSSTSVADTKDMISCYELAKVLLEDFADAENS